jgi:glycosyl transferase family 25
VPTKIRCAATKIIVKIKMNIEPHALVISLKRAVERRKLITAELSRVQIGWKFLDAIDGREITDTPQEYPAKAARRLSGYEMTKSELGCFMSHRLAWRACITMNKPLIIFEDDFLIGEEFITSLEIAFDQFHDWDICRLQGIAGTPDRKILTIGQLAVVKNLEDPLGAAAYIVKPSSAQQLLAASEKIYEPVDHFLEKSRLHKLSVVAIKPYPVRIRNEDSTILDRPVRAPIRGWRKARRSFFRLLRRTMDLGRTTF